MKKVVLTVIAAILASVLCFAIVGCGAQSKKVKVVSIELTGEVYAYGVNKNKSDLLEKVNEFLAILDSEDGYEGVTLDSLFEAEENGTATDIGTVKTGSDPDDRANQLVVVTNAEFEPFEYKKGDKYCGIDMHVAKLLAKYLDKELYIMNVDFENVVVEVSQGKGDIGMAGLTITKSRKEFVTCTNGYYETTQNVAVLDTDTTFDNCKTQEDVVKTIKDLGNVKAGAANGQTGYFYLEGDADMEFEGFGNVTPKGYESIALAVKDLSIGRVKFVVGDKDTLKSAVEGLNATISEA